MKATVTIRKNGNVIEADGDIVSMRIERLSGEDRDYYRIVTASGKVLRLDTTTTSVRFHN